MTRSYVTTTSQAPLAHDTPQIEPLSASPTMAAALEGLLAVPTCATPGCDTETALFADRCAACIAGAPGVAVEVDGPR